MHFLLIQLSLIIFYQKVFASIYDNPCTTSCNFPGMICAYGQCKCDPKIRLFWTGARCLSCPDNWAMSETKCIGYYGTKMSWTKAVATCQHVQGDLISLRDNSILPLIYQVTDGNNRRKKRVETATDKTVAWSSAHAIQLTNLGLYQWNDDSLEKFDSRHNWWCKTGIPNLGYYHTHQEPTRLIFDNNAEKCVLFRRGKSSVPMVCLDDVTCDQEYPFVCERSESTAYKFVGPAPLNEENIYGSSVIEPETTTTQSYTSSSAVSKTTTRSYTSSVVGSKTTTRAYVSSVGYYNEEKDPNINNEHLVGMLANPTASKYNKKKKTIIIIVAIGLLLLAAGLAGVFFFKKHRNAAGPQIHVIGNKIKAKQASSPVQVRIKSVPNVSNNIRDHVQAPIKSVPNVSNASDIDELPSHRTSADEVGLTLDTGVRPGNMDINRGNQKQQKNKRGGYSKQQFDEFE